jgi:hypothetical protein
MTIIAKDGHKIEFASAVSPRGGEERGLNLAPALTEAAKAKLLNLPCFRGADTNDLIQEAQRRMRGKVIGDRITAMLIIVGTRSLDNPVFQVPREGDQWTR